MAHDTYGTYIKELLRWAIPTLSAQHRRDSYRAKTGARYLLPYCVVRRDDGLLLLLNRDYKPIGLHNSLFCDYHSDRYLHLCVSEDQVDLSPEWFTDPFDGHERAYFYDHLTNPFIGDKKTAREYCYRMSKFLKLKLIDNEEDSIVHGWGTTWTTTAAKSKEEG